MAKDLDFHINGLEGVLEKLRTLSPKLQKKGLVAAVRKGANIVRDDARNRAKKLDDPETPEKVWKEIVVRVNSRRSRQEGGLVMQVGVRGGAKEYKDTAKNRRLDRVGQGYEGGGNLFYWRFLEFGTSKMAARPFMRPALESNVDKATDAIVAELKRQLDEAT